MLEYDGPLVRKNRELSEFVNDLTDRWESRMVGYRRLTRELRETLIEVLRSREVPYAHPIYGALEPKGSVADVLSKR